MGPLWYAIRAGGLKQRGHNSEKFRRELLNQVSPVCIGWRKGFSALRQDVGSAADHHGDGRNGCADGMRECRQSAVGTCGRAAQGDVGALRIGSQTRAESMRQLLVEGLLLGLSGGALGILLAPRFSAVLINMMWGGERTDMPFSSHVDGRILLLISRWLLSQFALQLGPGVAVLAAKSAPALKQQVITAGGPLRFRRIAVGVQVGLSLVLLVGAGLFMRTLRNLKTLNVGFPPIIW